jgi:hypothetical protein
MFNFRILKSLWMNLFTPKNKKRPSERLPMALEIRKATGLHPWPHLQDQSGSKRMGALYGDKKVKEAKHPAIS